MIPTEFSKRIYGRLTRLYSQAAEAVLPRILQLVERCSTEIKGTSAAGWDQRDAVLITYGDQVSRDGQHPLETLREFLVSQGLDKCLKTVHILPFCPYSSDDGFSVIDYRAIDPNLGDWEDVARLEENFRLMFDLVLNHASQHSRWFQDYLAGVEPYTRYFVEADPDQDLSAVTRPRSQPLLTPFETSRGLRHLWTTFSADQIDLNFAEPDVLLEMLDILLMYVQRGARIVRLDAIAYLWKEPGTDCIHLSETHEVVKLMRDVLEAVAPQAILLTETNVPHEENVSYFGDGDEAHMVYQFSLPPLLLDACLNQDATPLRQWLSNLEAAPIGATYFNFTASHDGVGVRPLEGLVPPERLQRLVEAVRERGGRVSTRQNPDGSQSPYELNISYLDALSDPCRPEPAWHAKRFLASQAIMLALRGMPAVYFHSLVGTHNDQAGVEASGHARRINRRKFEADELAQAINHEDSTQQLVFHGYCHLLQTRIAQPAFHPDANQQVWQTEDPAILAFERTDGRQAIYVIANLSDEERLLDFSEFAAQTNARDLLTRDETVSAGHVFLSPFQVRWLEADSL